MANTTQSKQAMDRVINLSDIPYDILECIVMKACTTDEHKKDVDEVSVESFLTDYNTEEDPLYEEEDKTLEVTDVCKHIETLRTICSRVDIEFESNLTKKLMTTKPDKCLPWILSSDCNTDQWLDLHFKEISGRKYDVNVALTAFEKACEYNNIQGVHYLLGVNELKKSDIFLKNCLFKACKHDRLEVVRILLRDFEYSDKTVYSALYYALPQSHMRVCEELIRKFPNLRNNYWHYQLLLSTMYQRAENDENVRFFVKYSRTTDHESDTEKYFWGCGGQIRLNLKEPLPASECVR